MEESGPAAASVPPGPAAATASLRQRALRGSLWTTLGYAAARALRLLGNIVLTRLLFPEAFGLMALVNVFLMGLQMFSDLGIQPSIVQSRRGDDPDFLDTAWTLQIGRGLVLSLLALGMAGPMAGFYGQPELAQLLPVAGLTALITGFESTSVARLRRHLSLGRITLLELAAQSVSLVVMISWALQRPTVWALVVGGLAASAVRLVLSHTWLRDLPNRPRWQPDAARELVRFGKWIFISTILMFLAGQLDRLIFGRLISLATLGVYSIAFMLAAMPTELIDRLGSQIAFPLLSRRAETDAPIAPLHRRARLPLLALGGGVMAALLAAGPYLIAALYDDRYVDAGWMLQVLAAGAWFRVLAIPSGAALMALGQPRWLAIANAAKVVAIPLLIPAGYAVAEFPGAVAGFAAAELVRWAALHPGSGAAGVRTIPGDLLTTLGVAVAGLAGAAVARAVSGGLAPGVAAELAGLASAGGGALLVWLPVALGLARYEGVDWRQLLRRPTA